MAIVKMKKVTIAAPHDNRDDILKLVQSLGCVHLVDLKEKPLEIEGVDYFKEAKTVTESEMEYSRIKFTYDFLNKYRSSKNGAFSKREVISNEDFEALGEKINWENYYLQSKEIEEGINSNKNRMGKILGTIELYSQWTDLDVSSEELETIKKAGYFIGTLNKKYEAQFYEDLSDISENIYIEKISEKQQDVNLFILFHKGNTQEIAEAIKKYGFAKANIDISVRPAKQIESLRKEEEHILIENKKLEDKARKLAENIKDIEKIYDYIGSKLEKDLAVSKLIKTAKTFILQGWIPDESVKEFEENFEKKYNNCYMAVEEPGEDDVPPVALKNNALAEPFEIVTTMYSMPMPNEVDPTPIFTPFFLLFFGMMMSDVGYGLGMLVGSIIMLKFMDIEGGVRKIAKLILYSSIPTIIVGFLYGSFFGASLPFMEKPIISPLDNPMGILGISVAFGIVHILVGLGIKGYQLIRDGHVMDAVWDVGTMYAIILGIIWFAAGNMGYVGGANIGKILAIIGVVGLFYASGRGNESIGGKIGGGLFGVYGLTGYVGDALSYSRLMALGLATGLIGNAFNIMIGMMGEGITLPKIVLAPIVLGVGHIFNLLINALGAYVHTSRLQYVEFFGKFYEGGGTAFEPLKIKTKFIKVNTEK